MPYDVAPLGPDRGDMLSPADRLRRITEAFWGGRSSRTERAYRADLLRIADWQGLKTIDELATRLLRGPHGGEANLLLEEFKGWAQKKGWAPSYVNNHLAAVRSLVKFSRKAGLIVWTVDVDDVPTEKYADTRGPGFDGMVATLEQAALAKPPARAARDVAVLSLFAMRGLRRDEIVTLDLEHVALAESRLSVLRKKKKKRVPVTVPPFCVEALKAWLSFRGVAPGPLFLSFSVGCTGEKRGRRRSDDRLAESSVWWLVKNYALKAGVPPSQARPHGFRHGSVTEVLGLSNGNIRAGQLFADHANPATTTIYDDNRQDVAGEMSKLLASKFEEALRRRRAEGRGGVT